LAVGLGANESAHPGRDRGHPWIDRFDTAWGPSREGAGGGGAIRHLVRRNPNDDYAPSDSW